eukprot:Stramenopile-MAST_4_protein_3079
MFKPSKVVSYDSQNRFQYEYNPPPGRIQLTDNYVEVGPTIVPLKSEEELQNIDGKWTAEELETKYPDLYYVEATVASRNVQSVQTLKSSWSTRPITWITSDGEDLTFFLYALWEKNLTESEDKTHRICHTYNNVEGKEECLYNCKGGAHRCLLCMHPEHGMFTKKENSDEYQCQVLEKYKKQRIECQLTHQEIEWVLKNRHGGNTPNNMASTSILQPPPTLQQREMSVEPKIISLGNDCTFTTQKVTAGKGVFRGMFYNPNLGFSCKAVLKKFESGLHDPSSAEIDKNVRALFALNKRTQHKYIVTYYHYFQETQSLGVTKYLVMEECKSDLKVWVEYVKNQEGRVRLSDSSDLYFIVRDLIRAYTELHQHDLPNGTKLSHRDVKPRNVLVQFDDSDIEQKTPHIKLCDFGHSKMVASGIATEMFTRVGTTDETGCWWAPEIIDADKRTGLSYRRSADLWPLGCLLHYLGTDGEHPLFVPRPATYATAAGVASEQLDPKDLVKEAARNTELRHQILQKSRLHVKHPLLYDLVEKLVRPTSHVRLWCEHPKEYRISIELCNYHPFLWDTMTCSTLLQKFYNEGKVQAQFFERLQTEMNNGVYFWEDRLNEDDMVEFKSMILAHERYNPMQEARTRSTPVHCLKKLRNLLTHKEFLEEQNYNAGAYEERVVKFIKQAFPELLVAIFDVSIMAQFNHFDQNMEFINGTDQFWQRWHTRYKYDPLKVSPPHGETYTLPSTYQHRVFGGEAACWGRCMETQDSFDTYVWVPLTAISERLWSARSVMSYENAEMRLTRTLALLSRRWRRTEEGAGDELDMVHLIRFHSRSADKRTVRI